MRETLMDMGHSHRALSTSFFASILMPTEREVSPAFTLKPVQPCSFSKEEEEDDDDDDDDEEEEEEEEEYDDEEEESEERSSSCHSSPAEASLSRPDLEEVLVNEHWLLAGLVDSIRYGIKQIEIDLFDLCAKEKLDSRYIVQESDRPEDIKVGITWDLSKSP
uniref:Uncharacterized protein n=1 Tax=Vespula pensylvanica TaxID=30213 RepID=A0A834PAJ2_VESPE|nr:hypothetical protein H0235_002722 [Vespula pensylvanica]